MNKIYKKIWNRRRGCFVAVSETMTSAAQRAGKASVVVGFLALTPITSNAMTTINGDAGFSNLPLRGASVSDYDYISDDVHVLGNFVYESSSRSPLLYVGNTSGSVGIPSITVTVDKNFTVQQGRKWSIAHNHNRGQNVYGSTVVHGNAFNYGSISVGTRNTSHQGSITANLTVEGTLFNYGTLNNNSDNSYGQANLTGTLSIGTLHNEGVFQQLGGSVTSNFGNVEQVSGVFNQTDNHNVYVSGSVVLNGGSLQTTNPLIVGQRAGNFSIGNSLVLAGGSLNQTSLLTQKSGQVSVTKGSYAFATINKENGSLSNSSILSISNFNQTNGSTTNTGNLTIGKVNLGGSLKNTDKGTLTLTGDVTSRGNLSSSGTLNNRGHWTETNRFTVVGALNNTGTVDFQNGFEFGEGRLTSSGTVRTNRASDVFDSLGTTGQQDLHYVGLGSSVPQEVKTSLSDFFQKYLPGTVAKNLADHASFTGGKVIVTGVELTQTQADDLKKAFKDKFLSFFSQNETAQLCRS